MEIPSKNLSTLRGNNNGTWGFGMTNALFPISMNGPFGSVGYPLLNYNEFPTILKNPQYNSRLMNSPAYNEQSFLDISGFSFSGFGNDNGPPGKQDPLSIFSVKAIDKDSFKDRVGEPFSDLTPTQRLNLQSASRNQVNKQAQINQNKQYQDTGNR